MRRLSPLLVSAFLLLLGTTPARGADWLSGPELAGAKALLRSSDVPAAKKKIEAAVAADPTNLRARYALVQCHILLGDLDAALAAAEKAVSDHPKSGYSHAALGKASLLLGDFKGADQSYTRVRLASEFKRPVSEGIGASLGSNMSVEKRGSRPN